MNQMLFHISICHELIWTHRNVFDIIIINFEKSLCKLCDKCLLSVITKFLSSWGISIIAKRNKQRPRCWCHDIDINNHNRVYCLPLISLLTAILTDFESLPVLLLLYNLTQIKLFIYCFSFLRNRCWLVDTIRKL